MAQEPRRIIRRRTGYEAAVEDIKQQATTPPPSTSRRMIAGGLRVGSSFASAPGLWAGAGIAGAGELLAQAVEEGSGYGLKLNQFDKESLARAAVEAGIGAVPAAKLFKLGKAGASALRSGAMTGAGEGMRQVARGEELDPAAIVVATSLGAATGGILSKFTGKDAVPKDAVPKAAPPPKPLGPETFQEFRTGGRAIDPKQLELEAMRLEAKGDPVAAQGLRVWAADNAVGNEAIYTAGTKTRAAENAAKIKASDKAAAAAEKKRIEDAKIKATADEAVLAKKAYDDAIEAGGTPETLVVGKAVSKIPGTETITATTRIKPKKADVDDDGGTIRTQPDANVYQGGKLVAPPPEAVPSVVADAPVVAPKAAEVPFNPPKITPTKSAKPPKKTITGTPKEVLAKMKAPSAAPAAAPTAGRKARVEKTIQPTSPELHGKIDAVMQRGYTADLYQELAGPSLRYSNATTNLESGQYGAELANLTAKAVAAGRITQSQADAVRAEILGLRSAAKSSPAASPAAIPVGATNKGLGDMTGISPATEAAAQGFRDKAAGLRVAPSEPRAEPIIIPPAALAEISTPGQPRSAPTPDAGPDPRMADFQQRYNAALEATKGMPREARAASLAPLEKEADELLRLRRASQTGGTTLQSIGSFSGMADLFQRNPQFAAKLGLGAAGAIGGAVLDPLDDPFASALLGAGAGISAPAIMKGLSSMGVRPDDLPELSEKFKSPQGLYEIASKVGHLIPHIQRFNYLASMKGLPANAIVGPWGSGFFGALTKGLSGDARGWAALKMLTPSNVYKEMLAGRDEAFDLIRRAEAGDPLMRAELGGVALEGLPSTLRNTLQFPATAMTSGDVGIRNILKKSGFSEDEAREITLTSEPLIPLFTKLSNLTRGELSPAMSTLFPFVKTPSNIAEQGLMRTPIAGFFANAIREGQGAAAVPMQEQLVQQTLGTIIFFGNMAVGANMDPETARNARRYLTNAAGQYSLQATIGFAAGQSIARGQPMLSGSTVREIGGALPLPTADPITDALNWAGGSRENLPTNMTPAVLRELIPENPQYTPSAQSQFGTRVIRRRTPTQ